MFDSQHKPMNYPKYISFFLFLACFYMLTPLNAQDTLLMKNGNVMVGELKEMNNGIVTMKTDYSDSDFKIKWKRIRIIDTDTEFLISVHPGKRYDGALKTVNFDSIAIIESNRIKHTAYIKDIVFFRQVNSDFLSNFNGELSLGLNFTKAQRASEFSIRSQLGYKAQHWEISGNYDDIRSTRKGHRPVERMEASLNYQYFLKSNWFATTEISLFSNTEQNISLRTLAKAGLGKFIIQDDKLSWSAEGGITYNNENFKAMATEDFKNSSELFLGTTLNIFDFKDFKFLSKAMVYPNLTESKRYRLDYSFDLKYKLPLDFFIKLNYTLNYDSKPIVNSSTTDYVFQTTVGWDFN